MIDMFIRVCLCVCVYSLILKFLEEWAKPLTLSLPLSVCSTLKSSHPLAVVNVQPPITKAALPQRSLPVLKPLLCASASLLLSGQYSRPATGH